MTARSLGDRLDDPRYVSVAVIGLLAAGLWVATWSYTSGMTEMAVGSMGAGATGMGGMGSSGGGALIAAPSWSAAAIAQTAAMWILMMAAMMLPAMAPVIAIYAALSAKEDRGARLAVRIIAFTLGYFALWAAFSIAAALLQLTLRDSAWFTMGGTQATWPAAGGLMLLVGLYQLTPIKHTCLRHCQHPLTFLMSHWREGLAGAFPVGARHGVYCVGCCGVFMAMMFVFGTMSLWWMALIALYFLAEKTLPQAEIWSRNVGYFLIAAGLGVLAIHLAQRGI